MTTLNQTKTIKHMKKKGFVESEGAKHDAYNYVTLDGKRSSITTHVSRGTAHRDISDNLISRMASQCGLERNEFISFARCDMKQLEYEANLKDRGKL